MPKFRKETGAAEFHAQLFTRAQRPQALARQASGTDADTASKLAQFYASLVETSGQPWATPSESSQHPAPPPAALPPQPPQLQQQQPPLAQPLNPDDTTVGQGLPLPQSTEPAVEIIPPGQRYPEPAGPAPTPTTKPSHSKIVVSSRSIGFKLLQQAGWTPGTGLGAREQGMQEPLQPEPLPGKVGLGFEKPKPKAKGKSGVDGANVGSKGAHQQPQHGKRGTLPEDPLDKEDIDTKVKRVRQVMQTEADDKAAKAISRYVYSAFRDATGEPTSDSNPLLRRNKLSATNPLL